jgi:hypothetical protein
MLSRRRPWLERIANWGTALAVPLVAIVGFKLLASARDPAVPGAAQSGAPARAAQPAAPVRVLAPPIDASAPPVVDLRPPSAAGGEARGQSGAATAGEDPRCATLAREIGRLDAEARRAPDSGAASGLRDRAQSTRAEARTLRCRTR